MMNNSIKYEIESFYKFFFFFENCETLFRTYLISFRLKYDRGGKGGGVFERPKLRAWF